MKKQYRDETLAIREQLQQTQHGEHSAPIFLTSSYAFESADKMADAFAGNLNANVYSRYSNPNVEELVNKFCKLEVAEAGLGTATGMAAIFSTFGGLLVQGDHVIASRALFGSTTQILSNILPKWGITCTYVDPVDVDSWDQAVQKNTRMLFVETPSNPSLSITDLTKAKALALAHNLIFVVDNCFATPILQKPMIFGADLVVHSATKYADGHGRVLGGVIVGKAELVEKITYFNRHTGPSLSPFNAWLMSKSMETLSLRVHAHSNQAQLLANNLKGLPSLDAVLYPFSADHPQVQLARTQMKAGGGIVGLKIKGDMARTLKFMNGLDMISISPNLGDTRSIATHPTSSTHSRLTEEDRLAVGISPNLVRISVGLEHIDDITEDIITALEL
ncbi:MAG: aminotransferase class I/II-fold pyridoxal phosphate-dependent enzyme [Saprospiraceae bacterium]|nr:aminotransferase class I/II-fold pyridoxal phosphate-dependent enzyme [Saprospiraceae bacterium]MBK7437922.1 aminotransferase class I/II-fold pyridoxal phosphate-dependent enzyme [Saprospiraceae bacterium]MBK8512029.1 aminotransferase class I/II-fold pyridoxal phosphate-dependent enzyme [Saprospiraceae bacterium]MBL0111973.1 aminotransferase class I/II-fold pyridoxal phosphate-dependent enzyme [Saprospiraceae bacterium]MBP8944161.1 aminotransferase class I/II-fold pyridoxal phosphate-depende